MISTAIEATGGPLVTNMLRCSQAINAHDNKTALEFLQLVTTGIREVGNLLSRMHERCDPQVLYHNIRPFCAGTKGMTAAGLPQGVFYDEGNGKGQWRQYSGGSNAQSSLIQLFDIFLSVDHHETGGREASPRRNSAAAKGYLREMREYMPRPHREFIAHVEQSSNLRAYISGDNASPELLAAYNDAVAALARVRDIHIQIVARYIVMPARSPPAPYIISLKGQNLAVACSKGKTLQEREANGGADTSTTRQLHGTGGTSVMPFLKRTRDETRLAAIA